MGSTVAATEWKQQESTGKHSQGAFPFLSSVKPAAAAPDAFVAACDDVGAIRYAAQQSGMDDFEIADKLAISHGYMSKVLHGTAGLHGKRLVKFMRETQSIAPLQWLAEQMGCAITQRDPLQARIEAMERELLQLRKQA